PPFGGDIPSELRQHVDGNVAAFQPWSAELAFVLGQDGNLWIEAGLGGWGSPPPPRLHVDSNVSMVFYAVDPMQFYVTDMNGSLWYYTMDEDAVANLLGGEIPLGLQKRARSARPVMRMRGPRR
ncbi:hypothetical protein, partial [Mycobacterium sp.]